MVSKANLVEAIIGGNAASIVCAAFAARPVHPTYTGMEGVHIKLSSAPM